MKITHMPSRRIVYSVAGAIVLLGIGFASITHADTRGTGVFIGANGNTHVQGATVTATSSSGLTATTNLAGNTLTWDVEASSTTRFGNLGTGLAALAHVAIGDIVSFWGKLSGSGSTLTVEAHAIKDHSKNGTTTPKVGKGKDFIREIRERFSGRGVFDNFLNVHERLKARFEARFGNDD